MFIKRRRVFRRRPLRRKPLALVRANSRVSRPRMFNPQPVFTETFDAGSVGMLYSPPTATTTYAGLLAMTISSVPQIAQYRNLYQKYRILKAVWLFVPRWGGSDVNVAQSGIPSNTTYWSQTRIVYAINDSPAQTVPANEAAVLQDNGCKIRTMSSMLKIAHRPVPDLKDSNGAQLSLKQKYINFATGAQPDVNHYGISYFLTCPDYTVTGGTTVVPPRWDVFCKLTFQLSDPR